MKKLKALRIGVTCCGILLLASFGVNVLLYRQVKVLEKNSPEAIAGANDELVRRARGLMELPQETPTVATVSDVDQLKGQPFFDKAKNGDRVLLFVSSRKAVLYDPASNRILEVGPFSDLGIPAATGSLTESAP